MAAARLGSGRMKTATRKGGHCHLLAHVPADLVPRLTGLQRGWLRRITGQPYRARVIHSKPIGGRLGLETGNPDLHAINLEAALVLRPERGERRRRRHNSTWSGWSQAGA